LNHWAWELNSSTTWFSFTPDVLLQLDRRWPLHFVIGGQSDTHGRSPAIGCCRSFHPVGSKASQDPQIALKFQSTEIHMPRAWRDPSRPPCSEPAQ
jgi:hypothetical protein